MATTATAHKLPRTWDAPQIPYSNRWGHTYNVTTNEQGEIWTFDVKRNSYRWIKLLRCR
jgi:hypothetical protein